MPLQVGFFGPFGTFTEQAARSQPDLAEEELIAFPSVPDVLDAVANGDVDCGVVPIENSIEGVVNFTQDALCFDYELLIKLVRKGYQPVEIPVNYRSRSFSEGKKVSVLRDPLTWLRALAWLRVTPIDPMSEIEHQL